MNTFWLDLRFGARLLLKQPGFTLLAVLTLALGSGASTALFSAAEAVYWRALPYQDAERLVYLSASFPNTTRGNDNFSWPAFSDWQAQSQSFERLAAYQDWLAVTLTGRAEPVRLTANFVSADYLGLLGAAPLLGRTFTPEEARVPASAAVAVISHACWQNVFSGDAAVIGKQIEVEQTPQTIIGVLRPEFRDLEGQERGDIDIWLPLGQSQQLAGNRFDQRGARFLWGLARLKPGVTLAAAKAETALIAERIAQANPATDKGFGLFVESLRDHYYRDLYNPLTLLLSGAALLSLIGCANVANLLLARVAARRKEMTVRAALGATRARLLRQLLAESLLPALAASVLGVLLAEWTVRALNGWRALQLPGFVEIRLSGWALAAALLLACLTGVLCGLAPAWESARTDLREALNQGSRQSAALAHHWQRRALVAGEIALAFVLLTGAGLMLRSTHKLLGTGIGFRTENLLTLHLNLNGARYERDEARVQFAQGLLEKADALPGVESATLWGPGRLANATWIMFAAPAGKPINGQADLTMAWRHSTNPGGLGNLGLPLLRGRDFNAGDIAAAPPVAIISAGLAERFWPGADALGQRLVRQTQNGLAAMTVVGVAADANHRRRYLPQAGADWAFQPQLDVYLPYAQRPNPILVVALRTADKSGQVLGAFRQAVYSLDPNLTLADVTTVDERLAGQTGTLHAIAALLTAYAAAAFFLAALGVYGLLAQLVAQRTHEIGIRLALGAPPRAVLRLILRQGLGLVAAGLAIGLLGAWLSLRPAAHLLFGVSVNDPLTLAVVSAALAAVAWLACYLPARRATKVDPLIALRTE